MQNSMNKANVWYIKTENGKNPLQPNANLKTVPRMYLKEMSESAKKKFPIQGLKNLYTIHDETGKELGVTDDYEIALKLAKNSGMELHRVH